MKYILIFVCVLASIQQIYAIKCDANERVHDCPDLNCPILHCPRNGSQMWNVDCPPPNDCPNPGCICDPGYRRSYSGLCIPTEDCPPFDCPPNEEPHPCPTLCTNDLCANKEMDNFCFTESDQDIIVGCYPMCLCKRGYFRNDYNKCVPKNECP